MILHLVICLVSWAMAPIFSSLPSQLFVEVSNDAQNASVIDVYGGIMLALAAADGILIGVKYFRWATHIRNLCFARVLTQDMKWSDRAENARVLATVRALRSAMYVWFVVVSMYMSVEGMFMHWPMGSS